MSQLKNYTVRLDEAQIETLKKKGIDVTQSIRDFVTDLADADVCPTCKQHVKTKRRKRK